MSQIVYQHVVFRNI